MTHIAGYPVRLEGRFLRQRCAWCGIVLLDYDLSTLASIDGEGPSTWATGALVEVNGNYSGVIEGTELPADSCSIMEIER